MGSAISGGDLELYMGYVGSPQRDILHDSDIHDTLLDMDAVDLAIIEEWHAGAEELFRLDQSQFAGISIDELLGKSSRFRREWLHYVEQARDAAMELSHFDSDNDVSDDDEESEEE